MIEAAPADKNVFLLSLATGCISMENSQRGIILFHKLASKSIFKIW